MTTTQSSLISNPQSTPRVLNDGTKDGAFVRRKIDSVAVSSGDLGTNDDTVELCDLPADAVVHRILIANDTLDGATSLVVDIGLYKISDDGSLGAAADQDVYATASADFQTATSPWTDYAFEARGIEKHAQKVFLDAGDTEDSHDAQYRLVMTATTAAGTDVAGDVSFIVEYSIPA